MKICNFINTLVIVLYDNILYLQLLDQYILNYIFVFFEKDFVFIFFDNLIEKYFNKVKERILIIRYV